MAELPNDENFAPQISFSVERGLLAYVQPDDYVLTVHGSICTGDHTEIDIWSNVKGKDLSPIVFGNS
jgi:hypothetical protein